MNCPTCGGEIKGDRDTYVNLVCDDCDDRAVNENSEKPESEDGTIQMAPDRGENPVFIDGEKCWRRYRFGGWLTMKDEHNCDSVEDFYEKHDMM